MCTAVLKRSRKKKLRSSRPGRRSAPTGCQSVPEWLGQPIPYVPHPAFLRKDAERALRRLVPPPDLDAPIIAETEPGLTFVAGFVSQPLLSAAEETSLFAWMNYHRFQAEELRRHGLRTKTPKTLQDRIRAELDLANRIRNRIVSSNLRLVVSLAKKLAYSLDHMSDLIGEGVLPLIRAVELFDISLGNRFSTYATWAVRNQMLRSLKRAKAASAFFGQPPEMLLESLPDQPTLIAIDSEGPSPATQVKMLLSGLSDRERMVVSARFGLAGEPAGQSLADIAERVGLSKERVRQIVLQSLENLRTQCVDAMETP